MGQLNALIEADPEAKDRLVSLLSENSKRTACQQVRITLFDNDDNVVGGPSLYDSTRAGTQNKDKNKVTVPNLPRSMDHNGSRTITNKMIHTGTIASEGEGLWIPKSAMGPKPKTIGGWRIRFTCVTTSRSDAISKGMSKRKRSESDSDFNENSD